MNLHPALLRKVLESPVSYLTCVLAGIAGGLLLILQGRLLSEIIARVFLDHFSLAQVQVLIRNLILLAIVRALLVLASDFFAKRMSVVIKANLRKVLLDHLRKLGPAYTHNEESAELTLAAVQGVEELDAYLSQYLPQLLLAAVIPLAILLFVFPSDILSGVVLLLTAPLIPIFMILIGKASELLTRRQWKALSRLSTHFQDSLYNLKMLKLYNQSLAQAKVIHDRNEDYRAATMNVLRVTFLSALVLEMTATLSIALVAVEIGLRVLYGRLLFQEAFFILVIAPEFYMPLRLLGLRFHAGMSGVAAARRIFEILSTPPPVQPPSLDGVAETTSVSIEVLAERLARPFRLEFSNVSLTYPGRLTPALETINLVIPSGSFTALAGPSGAGKTSLTHLLLRLVDPNQGELRLDDLNLKHIPPERWQSLISWVPQNPFLFFNSIAANIAMSEKSVDMARVRRAAEMASLSAWVESLPNAYETWVGERGAKLSGGQAQRLALARAFYHDRPILILDEPTSFLDAELEEELERIMLNLCRSRTVIAIAHRLSTIARADQVVVLHQGRIVESGPPQTLLQKRGAYFRLVHGMEMAA